MMESEQTLVVLGERIPQQQAQGLIQSTVTGSTLLNPQQASSSLQHHEHQDVAAAVAATTTMVVAPPTTLPPRRVDHTYRDYSNFPLEELPTRKKCPTNFPSKLHQILSNPEFAHIISWMPHGRAWKIHDRDLLIRDIVPKFFVQSKYESFTRQLNGWGFKRLHQSGNDFNAFYHECFLRGIPHLTVLMKRVPPNQGKLLPHVEGEPNFYEIDRQFPLPPRHQVAPSTFGGGAAFAQPAAGYGYGFGYGASPGLPSYYHHLDHFRNPNPANLVPSAYPGTNNMSYPPNRGEYQGFAQPPFLAPPGTNGQQPMMMTGGSFPPQYHPYSFDNPMLYHGMTPEAAPPTASLSSEQGSYRCVTDEPGAANVAFDESSTTDQHKEENDKEQE